MTQSLLHTVFPSCFAVCGDHLSPSIVIVFSSLSDASVGRKQWHWSGGRGGYATTAATGGRGSVRTSTPCVGTVHEGQDGPVQGSDAVAVTSERGWGGMAADTILVGDKVEGPVGSLRRQR